MIKNRIQMKAIICSALALVVAISFSSAVSAAGVPDDLQVVDIYNTCPEGEHVHEEDLVDPTADAPTIGLRGDIHCTKGSQVGHILSSTATKQKGSENRPCQHGRVGGKDYRNQYQKTTKSNCSVCSYSSTTVSTYWGSWICN